MRNLLIECGLWLFLSGVALQSAVACEKMPIIAITQVVEHPALDSTRRGILDELIAEGYISGENCKIVFESAQGNVVIASQIAKKFVSMGPEVIVAIGTTSAQAMKRATRGTEIPVVFSSITDPVGSRLVSDLKNPGANVTGLSNWIDMKPQLEAFRRVLPGLKRLGFIYNPGEANSVSLLQTTYQAAAQAGIEVLVAPAEKSSEVGQAALSLVEKVDAIFITNDNTALSAFESIVKVCNNARIPVFVSDTDMVVRGAVAAFGPNQYQLGRQTGQIVIKLLKGEHPKNIPVQFPEKAEFYINEEAIARIRLDVPSDVIESADKVIRIRDLKGQNK